MSGLLESVFNCVLGCAANTKCNRRAESSAGSSAGFQIKFVLLVIIFNLVFSGILGYVYFDDTQKLNKIIYFHVGLSAALIFRSLATTIPAIVLHSNNES